MKTDGARRWSAGKGSRRVSSVQLVESAAIQAEAIAATDDLFEMVDWSFLPREQLETWIEMVRSGEQGLRNLRVRLEALRNQEERTCPPCGAAVSGRADRVYCSPKCRQAAHRASSRV